MNENAYIEKDSISLEQINDSVTLIALRNKVVFPGQVLSLDIVDSVSSNAIISAVNTNSEVFFAYRKSDDDQLDFSDISSIGTLANIKQMMRMPNNGVRVVVKGLKRKMISSIVTTVPHFKVKLESYDSEEVESSSSYGATKELIVEAFAKAVKIKSKLSDTVLSDSNDNLYVSQMAKLFYTSLQEQQALLEIRSLNDQLFDIYKHIVSFCDIEKTKRHIEMQVRESINKNQREFYLREQLKVIHNELGDGEEELEQYREQLEAKKLPKSVEEKVEKEIAKMSKMSPSSPESAVSRSYIDLVLSLPWGETTDSEIDIEFARSVLDKEHYGLEKIKERIIEFLAVQKLKEHSKAPILCFVGPPGVGKTSIVQSIARAINRQFVQMSLGGIRDEAEIRGHRRTYIGSLPGRIIAGIKECGTDNPVFLLDEIDKMSSDFRGDPSSALLEVLDPNQNDKFKDHFLDVPYDLSSVIFITTANTLDTIAPPLLDRMEVIHLSGYTYNEKREIAKQYLLPKQREANGMDKVKITMTDEAIMRTIERYTRESGVRSLERELGKVIRKLAVKYLEKNKKPRAFTVSERNLELYLGKEKYREESTGTVDLVGKVTGLAWTQVGGTTLDIEVALIPDGKGDIKLTGNLGDVMKESAHTAMSFIQSNAAKYNIPTSMFKEHDLHIHFPEGAIPKDGPSAGIALATAIMSVMSGKGVASDITMTGEITLRGDVLAIGGLKEKSLAAMRYGKKRMLIPMQNEKDLDEIPNEVKEAVEITLVSNIAKVFELALR